MLAREVRRLRGLLKLKVKHSQNSKGLKVSRLPRRGRFAERETHRITRPQPLEQLETRVDLPERVERAVASGLLYEDADQTPGCEESDVSSDERNPGFLDPDLEGGEKAAHPRLNIDPAVNGKDSHDGVD